MENSISEIQTKKKDETNQKSIILDLNKTFSMYLDSTIKKNDSDSNNEYKINEK